MGGDGRTRGRGRQSAGGVLGGLGLITVGAVLLMDQAGVVDALALLHGWWPVLLVVAGAWWVAGGSWLAGTIAGVTGVLLLGGTLDLVEVPIGRLVLPLLMLGIGGTLITAGARLRAAPSPRLAGAVPAPSSLAPDAGLPVGKTSVTAIFGDADVVLDEAGLDGDLALVTATVVFGDVHVGVPWGWRVQDRTTALLGEVSVPSDQPPPAERRVVELHGLMLFGEARVRYHGRAGEG